MSRDQLTERLRLLVSTHGVSAVLHSLAEIESAKKTETPKAKNPNPFKSRPTAASYVDRMSLSSNKINVIRRVATMFDGKEFLPSLSDIQEFATVFGFDLPKSATRASAIPRVFGFIASMDTSEIEKILDDGVFSGPARLGPIADAIRGFSNDKRDDQHIVGRSSLPALSPDLRRKTTTTGTKPVSKELQDTNRD